MRFFRSVSFVRLANFFYKLCCRGLGFLVPGDGRPCMTEPPETQVTVYKPPPGNGRPFNYSRVCVRLKSHPHQRQCRQKRATLSPKPATLPPATLCCWQQCCRFRRQCRRFWRYCRWCGRGLSRIQLKWQAVAGRTRAKSQGARERSDRGMSLTPVPPLTASLRPFTML